MRWVPGDDERVDTWLEVAVGQQLVAGTAFLGAGLLFVWLAIPFSSVSGVEQWAGRLFFGGLGFVSCAVGLIFLLRKKQWRIDRAARTLSIEEGWTGVRMTKSELSFERLQHVQLEDRVSRASPGSADPLSRRFFPVRLVTDLEVFDFTSPSEYPSARHQAETLARALTLPLIDESDLWDGEEFDFGAAQ